jgi:hypothetical protein
MKVTDARRFVVGAVRPHERINLNPKSVGDLVLVSYEVEGDDSSTGKKVTVAMIHSIEDHFVVRWYGPKSGKYSKMLNNKFLPGWKHKHTKRITYSDRPLPGNEPYIETLPWPEHAIVDYGFQFVGDTQKLKKRQLQKLCAAPEVLFKMKNHDDDCVCVK